MVAFIIFFTYLAASNITIQSVEEYYLTHLEDIQPDSETVTLSIRCDTAAQNRAVLPQNLQDEKYVPSDGIILDTTTYVMRQNDTVFDILLRATQHNQIALDFQGADDNIYGSVYIRGINQLYEFSCGRLSGWMYRVNGSFPPYGVSRYLLRNGDSIEFIYTCDLGRDIGAPLMDVQKEETK